MAQNIHHLVFKVLADLNVKEKEQTIDLSDVRTLNADSIQYLVDFIRRNLCQMEKLLLVFRDVTMAAVEIFSSYLIETTLSKICLEGNLGNSKARRLLSGLHGDPSVKELTLVNVGLEGRAGGAILSSLLRNNSTLTGLLCGKLSLGVEGAHALQPGIRSNRTVTRLGLQECDLGDEGASVIVDALEGNTTVEVLCLDDNGITHNGLPNVTRLLQHASIMNVDLDNNPGLFHNEENSRLFASALRTTKLQQLQLNFCRLPGDVVISLFQALRNNKMLEILYIYDNEPLKGEGLQRLLAIIPKMSSPSHLQINLNFTDQAIVSSFHLNTSILYLCGANGELIDVGTVLEIGKRNQRLSYARQLLDCESFREIPLGLWSKAIEQLTVDNMGATATYTILHEKLVMWWAPQSSSTRNCVIASPTATAATAAAAAATTMPSSNSAVKRLHAQATVANENEKTKAKSSSLSFLEPQQKLPHHFKILLETLAMWWAPKTLSTTTNNDVISSPVAAVAAMPSCSNGTVKRSHAQASMGGDDEGTDEAKSSSLWASLWETQQKRPRLHLSPPKSTDDKGSSTTATASMINNNIGIDSLSKEELMEMIQQQKKKIVEQADTIAKIAILAKNITSTADGAEAEEEEDRKMAATTNNNKR